MKKVYLLFIFIILILTSCSRDDNFSRSFVSDIYNGKNLKSGSIVSYFLKDYDEIPYVRIELLETIIADLEYDVKYNDGNVIVTNKSNNQKAYISDGSIEFDNYDSFFKLGGNTAPLNSISKNNKYCQIIDYEYNEGNKLVLNLKKYDFYIYQTQNSCFIPFALFETIFLEIPFGVNFVFNGQDYYSISLDYLYDRYGYTSYGSSYYSLLNGQTESEQIKKFAYNQLLFVMDNFYGLKELKNIDNFSNYFSNIGINMNNFENKLIELTNYYLDDPHSSLSIPSIYETYNETQIIKDKKSYLGKKSKEIDESLTTLKTLRRSYNMFNDPLKVYNNVAYLIYDEFIYDSSLDLYNSDIRRALTDVDGFSYMYYYLNYIKNNYTSVDKIVIDISQNSGGYVDSAVDMLGFMKNNYYINLINKSTNSNIKLNINIDCNLDRSFSDLDSFENQFDFYILTSNASFSCANTFASVLQEQKMATIIGENSAGGACVVQKITLINGIQLNISGPIAFSNDDYELIENGITVDHKIDRINMYNPVYMNLFLNNLS